MTPPPLTAPRSGTRPAMAGRIAFGDVTGGGVSARQWLMVIGALAGLGVAQVSQQTAIRLKAYELGRLDERCHRLENDALWLKAKVVALQSPANLASVMQTRKMNLVAWSTLPAEPPVQTIAKAGLIAASE